jgi:hypothetical protein
MSIFLYQGTEDGPRLTLLGERNSPEVNEFLDDPVGTYGVKEFVNLSYFLKNPDANYWGEEVGMVLDGIDILPEPSGAFRLPTSR